MQERIQSFHRSNGQSTRLDYYPIKLRIRDKYISYHLEQADCF